VSGEEKGERKRESFINIERVRERMRNGFGKSGRK